MIEVQMACLRGKQKNFICSDFKSVKEEATSQSDVLLVQATKCNLRDTRFIVPVRQQKFKNWHRFGIHSQIGLPVVNFELPILALASYNGMNENEPRKW
jgi:hypothetical protein